jgi:hypothetical protein
MDFGLKQVTEAGAAEVAVGCVNTGNNEQHNASLGSSVGSKAFDYASRVVDSVTHAEHLRQKILRNGEVVGS